MCEFALKIIEKIIVWLGRRQRAIDVKILWPAFVSQTPDLDYAKACFYWHCMNDPAWTNHLTQDEITEFVENLNEV